MSRRRNSQRSASATIPALNAMPTFRKTAQRYLDDEAPRRLEPATIRNHKINIRRHANPIIGSLKISEIAHADVAATPKRRG